MKDNDVLLNKKFVTETTLAKYVDGTVNMECSSNSELHDDGNDHLKDKNALDNQSESKTCHLMEFSNSDLSDIESDNGSWTANSSNQLHSLKLNSSVIANLSMAEKDLQYALSCKVLLKPLCIVHIFPHDVYK